MTYPSSDGEDIFDLPNPDAPPAAGIPVGPDPVPTEPEAEEAPAVEFTPEEVRTFSSLLTVGASVKHHTLLGHDVLLATPSVDDELRIALFTKDFRDSEGYVRAFQTGVVAAAIREIDGEPFVLAPLVPETADELFARKVEKARQMYPLSISMLYQRVIDMEQEYAEMAHKLGKL